LYDNTRCTISCHGCRYDGFSVRSGIRQGCPLSPLLFAVVADLLLRKLASALPNDAVRAFADDTAMVMHDWWGSAGMVRRIFSEFSNISGLDLNLPKTVMIPLWPAPVLEVRKAVEGTLPEWEGINIAEYGTYLGFAEGPGKGSHTWDKAAHKYFERAQLWGRQGLGLFYTTTAYNTSVITVLSFIGQLENPPDAVLEIEKVALRHMASGPGNWILPADLQHLSECYGQAMSFNGIQTSAWSAQVRTALVEAMNTGGLDVNSRASLLRHLLQSAEFLGRRRIWQHWYDQSHLFVLEAAVRRFDALGTPSKRLLKPCKVERSSTKQRHKLGAGFQKAVRKHIIKRTMPDSEERMRSKLKRWHLPGLPRVVASRALAGLKALRSLVPPRVSAAVLSTMWNRWTTARRFQRRARCTLGCSLSAEDSIEHYSRCPVVRTVASNRLGMYDTGASFLPLFNLVADELRSEPRKSRLVRAAVLTYATYRSTQTARYAGGLTTERAAEYMVQYIKEAVRGHAVATRLIDSWWSDERQGATTTHQQQSRHHRPQQHLHQ
jgi:hypothetical protein